MKYGKIIIFICILTCVLLSISSAFANDLTNETIGESDIDSQELQLNNAEVDDINQASNDLSSSSVYFDASASNDNGDGSKSNPYKVFKSDRINYGDTVYFADGVYDITETTSIHSSSTYKTTFIGTGIDKTILRSNLKNKFDFIVTDNSYLVLNGLTMVGVHINNQANLQATNVEFRNGEAFNSSYAPRLSYSQTSKIYDSTYGGVIICDTPNNKITKLDLTDCKFYHNEATSGGVIAAYNTVATIKNSAFYNSTAERFGGAIYSIKSTFNIYSTSFNLNHAKYGGAIYANTSEVTIKDSKILNSEAFSFGGAIASFSGKLDINNVDFNDYASLNDAGGAIYSIDGTLKVTDSTFNNGYSDFGGAICNLKTTSTITGTNFENNRAQYYGGTIYDMYGSVTLKSNIFTNTNASSGGTIFNRLSDSFILSNNKFTDSTASEGPIIFVDGNKVNVVESGNSYDSSKALLKYGNIYDIEYYKSVPLIHYTVESSDSVPSFYDSRKYGYITPAKDQIQGGNCWAFSGIATLEACINKATGIAYDFSEENVKNLMSEYSLFDSNNGVNGGGNLYMFIAYLAGWFGPTYDINDIYDDYSSLSVIYDSLVHVQNVYILPERENFFDNDYIKKAVMDYGAVSIGIDLSENEGHAVTIIGWDDEFVTNDFLGNKAVGAWIIKNSWGPNWGYDGFGYLSYQQPIHFGYTFIFDDDRGYTDIYQYDYAGKKGQTSVSGDHVYIKNIFTAKNNEILSAVSTYFDEPTNYTVSINLNGKTVSTQDGYSEIGYYTIPLVKEVSMKKGDTFEVVIKIFNGDPVYIPICPANDINKMAVGKGISFYSTDGAKWNDLFTTPQIQGVACIKAFTRVNDLAKISISEDKSNTQSASYDKINIGDLVNIPLNLPEYFVVDGVKYPVDGLATFKINDQYYYATVENGKACLNITFEKEGTYNVVAQFKSNRVVSNEISFKINVVKNAMSNLVIVANDMSKFYGGSEKYVATLYNGTKALNGANVKITVNGKSYTVKTDSNGQAVLDMNLPVGVYEVVTQYGGKTATSTFTVLTTIEVNDVTQDVYNSYASASFLNTDGSFLSDKKITFSVEYYGLKSVPKEFFGTTNNLGVATAKINFYTGKYLATVTNPVNNEKRQFVLDIVEIDSETFLYVTQSGSSVIIDAIIDSPQATGYVNFVISGKVYKVNIQNTVMDDNSVAIARLKLDGLSVGDYSVSARYSGDDNLRSSSAARDFSVTKNPNRLSSSNYYSYYGGSGTIAHVMDSNGKPLQGEAVTATISGKTYSATTDSEGNAVFNLDLDVGNYTVLFKYKGQSLIKYVFVYSTISNVVSSSEYLNSKLGASFINPVNDLPHSNLAVKFISEGSEYGATTNSNGYASVDVTLGVGAHTYTTVNPDNGEKKQSKITIYKTTPTITLTKTKRGDGILITATLSQSSAIGNVIFTMGSNKYTTIIKDGKAVLALNFLEEGTYEVYANYIGDSNFFNILSPTLKFDYVHTNYALTAPKISKYYGGSELFKVTLTNYGKPVSGEIVNVTVDGKVFNVKTDSNGVASLNEKLSAGVHSAVCSFEDQNVLSEIEIKSTIIINNGVLGPYSKITGEFKDASGNLLKNKDVSFKVDSKEYKQTTDQFGVSTFNPGLNKGTYTVDITNLVTGEVKSASLQITKSAPSLSVTQVKMNGADAIKAELPKTATGDVDFVLDNGDEYSVEIVNGVAVLEGLDPGTYNVAVTYNGNDVFSSVSKSIKVQIVNTGVLSASKVTTTYGTSKSIVITLKDSYGNLLIGRKITVNLNKKNYQAVVAADGKAKITVPSNLAAKTYDATITYAGETNIKANTLKIKVVVNKATPKVTASKKTFKVKDKTKKYVVTLKTNKNKVYKNQKVTITVKGKTYTAKTNSKGQATFKLTKLTKKGSFTAKVKYSGNSNYKAVTKSIKITVK